jgi:hypothetical protein
VILPPAQMRAHDAYLDAAHIAHGALEFARPTAVAVIVPVEVAIPYNGRWRRLRRHRVYGF